MFERYQKREKLFAELRSMKYRIMATFGSEAGKPFDELNKVLNEIFASAHILGTYYWKKRRKMENRQEIRKYKEEMHEYEEEMRKHEEIFWFMGEDKDEITPRVQRAIEKIEKIARDASGSG